MNSVFWAVNEYLLLFHRLIKSAIVATILMTKQIVLGF